MCNINNNWPALPTTCNTSTTVGCKLLECLKLFNAYLCIFLCFLKFCCECSIIATDWNVDCQWNDNNSSNCAVCHCRSKKKCWKFACCWAGYCANFTRKCILTAPTQMQKSKYHRKTFKFKLRVSTRLVHVVQLFKKF